MQNIHQILKNCGNFSVEVLPGMIAYGRETEKGRGHIEASVQSSNADGYVTQESDIQLGGFIQRRYAQEAVASGQHLAAMSVEEKQKLALKTCNAHLTQYGSAGPESFKHWMKRVQGFARHHGIVLPPKGDRETEYDYSRRMRRWICTRPEKWPELRPAVATHLVFSPEPKLWESLRTRGVDERYFLRTVLVQTMKEFSDWRRQLYGQGHSLGWVAGTHVKKDGSNHHPHIHVVVLKRDEAGREVDWSVSSLKGRRGREHEPDPLNAIKRLWKKNVEKAYERSTGQQISPTSCFQQQQHPIRLTPKLREFSRGLRAVSYVMRPFYSQNFSAGGDLGAMLRIVGQIQRQRHSNLQNNNQPNFPQLRKTIAQFLSRSHQPEPET